MTQPQRQDDVHQDELCPPNKRYALMDANKKIDLHNPLCSNESKILANILQNHPLRFNIASSSLVPWIYLGQFWNTLKEDGSKYRLSFVLDRKELTEGLHYSLEYPSTLIPYPIFTKLIMRKNKAGVGMNILSWMITDEMKLTENYQILHIPPRRLTRLTPPTPILTVAEVENMIVQDTIQLSIAKQKSHDDLEGKKNKEKVKEQLIAEEIKKMVEGTKNVEEDVVVNYVINSQMILSLEEYESAEDDYELRKRVKGKNELAVTNPIPSSSTPASTSSKLFIHNASYLYSNLRLDVSNYTRVSLMSCKDDTSIFFRHLKTRFLARKKFNVLAQHLQKVMEEALPNMVDDRVKELTKTQVPLYVVEGLIMERKQNQADVAKMIADAIQQERNNLLAEITSQINNAITNHIPSQVDLSVRNYMSALKIKFEGLHASNTPCRSSAIHLIDLANPHDDAYPKGENNAKR
uniref:Uncharacterized protein n=1 Tax=Tanacetum cinerariifolium TaxID=118510 RepID=A0A699HIZ8_TANCI|nr:hypothetical protein [Tanacetum cinerariifolium]